MIRDETDFYVLLFFGVILICGIILVTPIYLVDAMGSNYWYFTYLLPLLLFITKIFKAFTSTFDKENFFYIRSLTILFLSICVILISYHMILGGKNHALTGIILLINLLVIASWFMWIIWLGQKEKLPIKGSGLIKHDKCWLVTIASFFALSIFAFYILPPLTSEKAFAIMERLGDERNVGDHFKSVRLSVERNKKMIHQKDVNGETLLHKAMKHKNCQMINVFIQNGANPNTVNKTGETPLHILAKKDKADFIEALIEHGAKIDSLDSDDRTPLSNAAMRGNTHSVKTLLKHGASIKAKDKDGNMPIHLAIKHKCEPSCVRELIKAGANLEAKNREGNTPFLCLISESSIRERFGSNNSMAEEYSARHDFLETADILYDAGADIQATDKKGNTALHIATCHCNNQSMYDIARLLIKYGASLDIRNGRGEVPLIENFKKYEDSKEHARSKGGHIFKQGTIGAAIMSGARARRGQ